MSLIKAIDTRRPALAVIGGGPAGLMAAEVACAAGLQVDLYEHMGSVGRKFLLAGKGGLNLTHGEAFESFVSRYRDRRDAVSSWLQSFDPDALRLWARGLGVETFVGSSGRVFPTDLKAAPLLRGWVRRLRAQGVRFHMHHELQGWHPDPLGRLHLRFAVGGEPRETTADAAVLALGGGSWPQLGSDGGWVDWMRGRGIDVAPLQAANGGFDLEWTPHFIDRYAGHAIKPVALHWQDLYDRPLHRQGELIVTETGLEGGLLYAASAELRELARRDGHADIRLDLFPDRSADTLAAALSSARGKRSLSEHLRRTLRLTGVRAGLLFECLSGEQRASPATLAPLLKAVPLRLSRPRPLAGAISSAGGVRLQALDARLMSRVHPGVFFAGEMLDWEAPTGGYLLTACFASGRHAALGALDWLAPHGGNAGRYADR
ncbi:TIGR03862 family flavoprotein [Panacagrimonas sp.]|uniref:TIGR03862 family flavoprotein n=1 Tax=Panacagrimonas sp. TaxID=2480088 RepID=UPI003B526AFD